jgi:hypothetical protein
MQQKIGDILAPQSIIKKKKMLTYISNTDHYKEVLSRVQSVKHMLWIGTADIKDLYVYWQKKNY